MTRLNLVFDADDTLWDNNVLFNRVVDDYLDWLAHPTLSRDALRAVLDDVERANAAAHGYGSRVFLRGLHDCFARLSERPATPHEAAEIDALARALLDSRVELLPGVADTLTALGDRHDLYLLTKGDQQEQQRKIDASGLAGHFRTTHVVREKHAAAYRDLAARHAFDPDRTWMIGNSPRSDILPAREAGWGAVHVPYAQTWALELADLDPADERVLTVDRLPDLLLRF